jgi:hypothetical protein
MSKRLSKSKYQIEDLEMKLNKKQGSLSSKQDLNEAEVLYSICTEFFVERINFKKIMFTKHLREMDQYGSFAPNVYFTNEFEFGAH